MGRAISIRLISSSPSLHLHQSPPSSSISFFLSFFLSLPKSTAMGRNTVKKQIFLDGVTVLVGPGQRVINILAQKRAAKMARNVTTSGADSSDRVVNDPRTNEPVVTGQSPATDVDECLMVVDDLPSAKRKNPTAAILPQVDMTNAIVHQRSMLYEKHKGKWVVEFIPESSAESMTQ